MIKILTHLLSYQNEKNQIMKSNVWLRLVWSDYQLQWDEADYGGIGVLRLPPDKVWKVSLPEKNEKIMARKESKKRVWEDSLLCEHFFFLVRSLSIVSMKE